MESVFDKIIENFDRKNPTGWEILDIPIEEKRVLIKSFLSSWLIKASKALSNGKSSITTHPCKLIHPDEKETTPIIAKCSSFNDGYIKSGNVFYTKMDFYGNAANIPYYRFLQIILSDGKSIFEHIESDTPESREILSLATGKSYEEIRNGFLSIKKKQNDFCTSNKIKQVYFPIGNKDYHLLSILMPSGIMSELKAKIDRNESFNIKEKLYELKNKKKYSEKNFVEFPDMTIVGFGGANPRNISLICNDDSGKYYFLPSFPPTLDEDRIKTPAKSFFKECLKYKYYLSDFKFWHKLLKNYPDNSESMKRRDKIIQNIFDDILRRCLIIRSVEKGWSNQSRCAELPEYQKIFLDSIYENERQEAEKEFKEFVDTSIRWIINGYTTINGKESVKMLDDEFYNYKKKIKEQAEVLLWQ